MYIFIDYMIHVIQTDTDIGVVRRSVEKCITYYIGISLTVYCIIYIYAQHLLYKVLITLVAGHKVTKIKSKRIKSPFICYCYGPQLAQ